MSPAAEKARSGSSDIAGIEKRSLAIFDKRGYFCLMRAVDQNSRGRNSSIKRPSQHHLQYLSVELEASAMAGG